MKDLLLDENGDLNFSNGDLNIGDSQQQSVQLLLSANKGEFKNNPTVGCSLAKAKSGAISRFLKTEIREQLRDDNFKIQKLELTTQGILLNGEYKST